MILYIKASKRRNDVTMKNSAQTVKRIMWAAVIVLVIFVVLPLLLSFAKIVLSFLTAIVMIGFFLGLGYVIYRTFTTDEQF